MQKGTKHNLATKEKMKLAKLKNPVKYWLGRKRLDMKGNKFGFMKGQISWNKGKKRWWKSPTEFKRGHIMTDIIKSKISQSESGENHYNWQGGKSFEIYPQEFNHFLKKKIKNRDDNICQLCNKVGNVVHHIDYNKKNCNDNNLITLCRKCNGIVNFKRQDWTNYFKNILNNCSRRD